MGCLGLKLIMLGNAMSVERPGVAICLMKKFQLIAHIVQIIEHHKGKRKKTITVQKEEHYQPLSVSFASLLGDGNEKDEL